MGLLVFGGVSTGKSMLDNCDVVRQVPEALGTRPREYCRVDSPFLTQVKLNAVYTIPKADVLVSTAFQSIPGPVLQANLVVTERAPGVPLVGATNVNVGLLPALPTTGQFTGCRVRRAAASGRFPGREDPARRRHPDDDQPGRLQPLQRERRHGGERGVHGVPAADADHAGAIREGEHPGRFLTRPRLRPSSMYRCS
jgi:hypothetical protein